MQKRTLVSRVTAYELWTSFRQTHPWTAHVILQWTTGAAHMRMRIKRCLNCAETVGISRVRLTGWGSFNCRGHCRPPYSHNSGNLRLVPFRDNAIPQWGAAYGQVHEQLRIVGHKVYGFVLTMSLHRDSPR
ncbi:hypothetical protein BKA93DRAFT_752172 [Sparassis latifolia]